MVKNGMREGMFMNEFVPAIASLEHERVPMHLRTLQAWVGEDGADVAARVEELAHVIT